MTVRQTIWGVDERARRQRIFHEVQQLRQMSQILRTTAMHSFMKRITDARAATKRPEGPPKPTSIAA